MKSKAKAPVKASFGLLFACLLPVAVTPASAALRLQEPAPTRDVTGGGRPVSVAGTPIYKNSYALVIGVSKYSKGWRELPGVRDDVEEVSAALKRHGFEVERIENPTRDQLDAAVRNFISKRGQDEENRLVIYFAGHGHTVKMPYGSELGYIVPADAPEPEANKNAFVAGAISMGQVEIYAKEIFSKHALFVFDSCFSGSLFNENTRSDSGAITAKTKLPVREFLTAGSAEQKVPDKSIFRKYFIKALAGEADANRDGYVTGNEMGEYIYTQVADESRGTLTPRLGTIRDANLNQGDFVFSLPGARNLALVEQAKAITNRALAYLILSEYQKAAALLEEALPIWVAGGDVYGQVMTLSNMGFCYDMLQQSNRAQDCYQRARKLLQTLGDRRGEANMLTIIGQSFFRAGNVREAADFYDRAVNLYAQEPDSQAEWGKVLNETANVYTTLGDAQRAVSYYQQAVKAYRKVGDKQAEAVVTHNAALAYLNAGKTQEALQYLNQALPLYEASGDVVGQAQALRSMGQLYEASGDKRKARQFFERANALETPQNPRRELPARPPARRQRPARIRPPLL